jgi:hypothetical protein
MPPNAPALRRRITGTIAYRGADGSTQGHEYFDLSSHAGGHILRALCVLDDVDLLRDVTIGMDADRRPIDGYCRLTRGGVDEAALWFRVGADGVRVDADLAGVAQPTQHIATERRLAYLGLHPLQGDALIVTQRGINWPGRFVDVETITNSISPNGDEAVGAVLMTIAVAYVGTEQIEIAAGSFTARRYALRWREDWPAADLWVRQEDAQFLLMRWSQVPGWYELIDYTDTQEPQP